MRSGLFQIAGMVGCCLATARAARAAQEPVVAVLEMRLDEPGRPEWKSQAAYLTNRVRGRFLAQMPHVYVISRENLLSLLEASGKQIEKCESECEVETGRLIGADLIIGGEITHVNQTYRLALRMHETKSGRFLASAVAGGNSAEELDLVLAVAVDQLVASAPDQFTGKAPLLRKVGYVSVAAAVVAAGAAGILGWQTRSAAAEWSSATNYATWSSARNRSAVLGAATTATWIAAGAFAVAGGLLIYSTSY